MVVLSWLEKECPEDLVGKILAFAGPQEVSSLKKTRSKKWQELLQSELLWRVLCEELQKWKPGEPEPRSWRDHYGKNVFVPMEFKTIQEALQSALAQELKKDDQNIRILLRPGIFRMEETLVVNTPSQVGKVTIETVDDTSPSKTSYTTTTQSARSGRASIVFQTKKRNQPIFHAQGGALHLRNVKLEHSCYGNNYCRGNGAIHVQPPSALYPSNSNNLFTTRPSQEQADSFSVVKSSILPSVSLENVEITSHSGQGIMNYHGGNVRIQNCYIHDCAATGLFVEAPQCNLMVQQSDIMGNDHAGVHLELGTTATVVDCGIVGNSSIGVSVYDTSLSLELSDVVANGYQLETERPPRRLRKNNIMTSWWGDDDNDDDNQNNWIHDMDTQQQPQRRLLTRTPMAQGNFVNHLSKVTRLMINRRIRR